MERLRVVNVITKMARGGAQATVLGTLSRLDPDSFERLILTGPDVDAEGDLFADAVAAGIEVEVLPGLHRKLSPVGDLVALVELARAIRRRAPDVVHTHSSKAGVLGRVAAALAGCPVIVHTVHGWSFNEGLGAPARRAVLALERFLARITDSLVVVTTRDREAALEFDIAPASRITLIRSGIALEDFEAVRRPAPRMTRPVVGSVTRLVDQKDPLTLLRAFEVIAGARLDVRFRVIGDGPLGDAVRRRVADSPLLSSRVELAGVSDDVPSALAGLDVFVLTSRWEGLPRAVIEAMAAGVPVVATDVGGISEVVQNNVTGMLVAPGDPVAVAAAVTRLLDDPELAARCAMNAAVGVEAFSDSQMAADVAALYRDLVEVRRRVRRRRRMERTVASERGIDDR